VFTETPVYQMHTHSEQLIRNNLGARRWSGILLAANLIGAVVYVVLSSHAWAIPQEGAARVHSVSGEPFIWAMYVMPICGFFFVLNLTWGAFIIVRRQWSNGVFWLLTLAVWLVGVAVDFAHH
jgi:hypothetical protein